MKNDSIDWTHLFSVYKVWKEEQPESQQFFNNFFEKLAGSKDLQKALEDGATIDQWRASYRNESFTVYLDTRQGILLY